MSTENRAGVYPTGAPARGVYPTGAPAAGVYPVGAPARGVYPTGAPAAGNYPPGAPAAGGSPVAQTLFRDPGTTRIWWLDERDVLHWVVDPGILRTFFGPQPSVTDRPILNVRRIGANIDGLTPPRAAVTKSWSYSGITPGSGRLLRAVGTQHIWWLADTYQLRWVVSPALVTKYFSRLRLESVPLSYLDQFYVSPNIDR